MSATPPFVVFALPRSRTAWLAHWLATAAGAPVGHDLAIEADSIDQWLECIARWFRGTCETGAVEAWPIVRRSIPACRIITVHRPVEAVCASLEAAGYPAPRDVLERRHAALEALAGEPEVMAIPYDALQAAPWCAVLQEYALGLPFDWQAWLAANGTNIQVDRAERLALLAKRHEPLERLKAELVERLAEHRPFLSIGEEHWAAVVDEYQALGAEHYDEAVAGIEGEYRLDRETLGRLAEAGLYRVVTARIDGALVGYCSWTHEVNAEASAQPTMRMGPFYAAPQFACRHLGERMLEASRRILAPEGYRVLRLHHTLLGRGARAGILYTRLGAVPYQHEYIWRVGADA